MADQLQISNDYVSKIVHGFVPSSGLAVRISLLTRGKVTYQELMFPEGVPEGLVMVPVEQVAA